MLIIKDAFQDYIQTNYPEISSQKIFVDIILYLLVAYTYYFGNLALYTKFIKYLSVFLLTRFLFNIITNYTYSDNKNHFQINSYIGIFVLIILLTDVNIYTQGGLILFYTLFTSAIYGYTTDSLLTVMLVYSLLQVSF